MFAYYTLPLEFRSFFSELSDSHVNQLLVAIGDIEGCSSREIAQRLIPEILSLLSTNTANSVELQPVRRLLYCCYALAIDVDRIIETVDTPTTWQEYIWFLFASSTSDNWRQHYHRVAQTEIPEYNGPDSAVAAELTLLLNSWRTFGGDPASWPDRLDDLVQRYPVYFSKNLVETFILIHIMSTPVSHYPSRAQLFLKPWITLARTANLPYFQIMFLLRLSGVYIRLANFAEALSCLEEAAELAREQEYPEFLAQVQLSLGKVHRGLGDLDSAFHIFQAYFKDHPQKPDGIYALATVEYSRGNYYDALQLLEQFPIESEEQLVFYFHELYQRVLLKLEKNEDAGKSLQLAEAILQKHDNKLNRFAVHRMRARQHYREQHYGLAELEYSKAREIAEQSDDLAFLFPLLTEFIEVQLEAAEREAPGGLEAKSRVFDSINNLVHLALDQEVPPIAAQGLIMRAKLYESEELTENAEEDLKTALSIAEKSLLHDYKASALKELQRLRQTDIRVTTPSEGPDTNLWQAIRVKLGNILTMAIAKPRKYIAAEIHGIFILNEAGLPIYEKLFSTRLETDPALISGVITAISSFIAELISGHGFLRGIQHDDLTIMLEPQDPLAYVCIASQETYELRKKLQQYRKEASEVIRRHSHEVSAGRLPEVLLADLSTCTATLFD
ncbi:MAG: tetratricopeptide repeat protein [Candidatus Heimdallarchaeota archaeon]